jgi:1-acyl-sn-glycerol-3-phosphate acyltransferase
MRRRIIIAIIRLILKLFTRVQVIGLKNVPRQGAVILAINHMSLADPPLAAVLVNRRDMTALVGDTHQKVPPLRWLVNAMGGIWINRQEADLHALRQALDFLAKGGLLGIAPEGTRSRVGSLIPAKTGVAYLADKAKVPVIPAAISGSEVVFREMILLHRPRLKIQFGQPFYPAALERKDREAGMQRNTDEIMCRIAVMLPEKYWGVYRDHPRLAELNEQQGE